MADQVLLPTPEDLARVPAAQLPGLIAQLAGLTAAIGARLAGTAVVPATPMTSGAEEEIDLVDAALAARLLGLAPTYVQKRSRAFPFRVEVLPGRIRYSRQGIAAWLALPAAERRARLRPAPLASVTRLRLR